MLRERTAEVAAAYGQLRASGTAISMCIASGGPLPQNISLEALADNANNLLRLDGEGNLDRETDSSSILLADEILEWDTVSGTLRTIKIPQNPKAPLVHSTEYMFLNHDKVALAGLVNEPQQAVLACFSAGTDEPLCQIFSPGASSVERIVLGQAVAHPGSTETSDILIHQHDRITVFKRGLLSGDVPVGTCWAELSLFHDNSNHIL
ncbi:hypothetical protein JB92DRAFT_74785 [Gautieria morchelliformis]|nr:hypothetical protein JB92DRAFT_74785 [Gautieria morchelliformis]